MQKTKLCSYSHCKHNEKINLSTDTEYIKDKNTGELFHKDCWHDSRNLVLIRNIWKSRVNHNTPYWVLNRELDRLIEEEQMNTDYLLFVLQYVLAHKMTLNYPAGLKFYLHKPSILQAYADKNKKTVNPYTVKAKVSDSKPPEFETKNKRTRFSKIFGGGE